MRDLRATGRQAPRSAGEVLAAVRRAAERREGAGAFRGWRQRATSLGCAALVLLMQSCAGGDSVGESARYPEKKRPEPLRSASDGEIMGADGVSPDDRLEGSATPQHPGAGWVVEDGKLMPEAEAKRHPGVPGAPEDPLERGLTPSSDCIPQGAPGGSEAGAKPAEGPVVQASSTKPTASSPNGARKRTTPVCPPAPKP